MAIASVVRKARVGVTLIEVIVVVAVIGLLMGLLVPAIQNVRAASDRMMCISNMRQIGIGLHSYHNDYKHLPPRAVDSRRKSDENRLLGWMVLILPYIDDSRLFSDSLMACQIERDVLRNPPHVGMSTVVKLYTCPSDSRLVMPLTDQFGVTASFTSYIGIAGTLPAKAKRGFDGVLGGTPGRSLSSITDGLSNTIMVGERPPPDSLQAGWYYPGFVASARGNRGPNNALVLGGGVIIEKDPCRGVKRAYGPGRLDNPCDRFHPWSLHPNGSNFLFADLSVRFLPYTAEGAIWGLASRNGGEVVDASSYE